MTGIRVENGRVAGVVTGAGEIACEKVVNCAGQWSRAARRAAGVNVPLVSVQHQYLVTERIAGVTPTLPTLRDPDRLTYYKEEVGGLIMGGYEPNPRPWAEAGVPEDFAFQLLDGRLGPFRADDAAGARPGAGAGDGGGEAVHQRSRELHARRQLHPRRGAGGRGISSSAPASTPSASPRAAARAWRSPNGWRTGAPPYDLWPVDIRRFGPQPRVDGLGADPHAGGLRPALRDGLAARRVCLRPAAAPLAALRPAGGQGRGLRREARLGAAELVRRRPARRRRTCPPSSGRTGSRPSRASTAPAARRRRSSTRPPSRSSC